MATEQIIPSSRAGGALVTAMTTELNSLGNNSAAVSSALSNDAADEGDIWATFELTVQFGSAPTENATVDLYLVESVDASNFEDQSSEGRPVTGYVGGFVLDNVTSAQRVFVRRVALPPTDFKLYVINKSGQAFPASGSVIKAYFFRRKLS